MKGSFKVNQIICLEDRSTCLYGEVIQLIPKRQMCWFRPLCMTIDDRDLGSSSQLKQTIDLSSGSDLLWPISLFRAALDVEVIDLLNQLNRDLDNSTENQTSSSAGYYLNQFVRRVWQSNQDKF